VKNTVRYSQSYKISNQLLYPWDLHFISPSHFSVLCLVILTISAVH